jgi:hypothetical protein
MTTNTVLDPFGQGCVTVNEDELQAVIWPLVTFLCPVAALAQRTVWTCF